MSLRTICIRGKTVLITGASRGIGREIALQCAKNGANVGLLARSERNPSHDSLTGTLEQVANEVNEMGGKAMTLPCDLRNLLDVKRSVRKLRSHFGSIDAVVNNASALSIDKVPRPETNKLMMDINTLGTANIISLCYDDLLKSKVGHILSISPPLSTLSREWIHPHPVYTTSKYGMTMVTLGYSDQLFANTLWPRKLLKTAATRMMEKKTGIPSYTKGLDPKIFAEVACKILTSTHSGLSCLDDDIQRVGEGIDDIFIYSMST